METSPHTRTDLEPVCRPVLDRDGATGSLLALVGMEAFYTTPCRLSSAFVLNPAGRKLA